MMLPMQYWRITFGNSGIFVGEGHAGFGMSTVPLTFPPPLPLSTTEPLEKDGSQAAKWQV